MVSHENKRIVESTLNAELLNVSSWVTANKLSLHLGKTESILFGSKIKLKGSPGFNVVGGTVLAAKESANYLGCVLDIHISGMGWAEKVLTKVNQRTCLKHPSRQSLHLSLYPETP